MKVKRATEQLKVGSRSNSRRNENRVRGETTYNFDRVQQFVTETRVTEMDSVYKSVMVSLDRHGTIGLCEKGEKGKSSVFHPNETWTMQRSRLTDIFDSRVLLSRQNKRISYEAVTNESN